MINWLYEKTRWEPLLRFYDPVTTLIPDPQDSRDYIFEWDSTVTLPASVDLREFTGQIEDQLSIGSCVSNALVNACEMYLIAAGQHIDTPATDENDLSRLFNYWNSRQALPTKYQEQDLGSTAREALRSSRNHGVCSEQVWPYDTAKWNDKPSDLAYAGTRSIGEYSRIENGVTATQQIKYALMKGWPVMLGMRVGEMLRTLQPGDVYPYKNTSTNKSIGGHEMLIVGYDGDDFIVENSWGSDWCDNGYFRCRASVIYVDMIDVWVVKGFAGYDRIGIGAVDKAYREMLHREPDAGGYAYWNQRIDTGMSIYELRCNFATSQEFIQTHLTVESLYQDLLMREPDAGGLAWWKSSGFTLPQIIEKFIVSAEFAGKFS